MLLAYHGLAGHPWLSPMAPWQEPRAVSPVKGQGSWKNLPHSGPTGCCALGTATALRLCELETWASILYIQDYEKIDKTEGKNKTKRSLPIFRTHTAHHTTVSCSGSKDRSKLRPLDPWHWTSLTLLPSTRASQATIHKIQIGVLNSHFPYILSSKIFVDSTMWTTDLSLFTAKNKSLNVKQHSVNLQSLKSKVPI